MLLALSFLSLTIGGFPLISSSKCNIITVTGGKVMILTSTNLLEKLASYREPEHKIRRLVSEGKIVKLRRGLYLDNAHVSPCAAAYQLYGLLISLSNTP